MRQKLVEIADTVNRFAQKMQDFSYKNFPDRLREVIKQSGLKDSQFAQKIGIQRATLSGYLVGKTGISQKTLTNIVRQYGVNANWLLTGDGPMYRHAEQAAEQSTDYETSDERIYRRQAEAYQAQKEYMEYVLEQLSAANAPDEMKQQAIMEILMPSHSLQEREKTKAREGRREANNNQAGSG